MYYALSCVRYLRIPTVGPQLPAYVGVNGKRRLQNTHPCVVRGTKIGDRCLVITDIKIVMTAWYINPGGGKTEIGR